MRYNTHGTARPNCAGVHASFSRVFSIIRRKLNHNQSKNGVFVRFAVLCTAFIVALCYAGGKRANAGGIKDIPARIAINASADFNKVSAYPGLFGTSEKSSDRLKPFTKWSDMFDRFENQLDGASSRAVIKRLQNDLTAVRGQSIKKMAAFVNNMMNAVPYIKDSNNWGQSDYWATPIEFMQRGGDCEDYAIAKYTALRALGVPEERLRLAIVHDTLKNIPHAVLVVYTDSGSYVLDNQEDQMISAMEAGRYRPIFSINREAWWLHTAEDDGTRLASAN
jgi:predicted transglutaminase-like cysteine proteinase